MAQCCLPESLLVEHNGMGWVEGTPSSLGSTGGFYVLLKEHCEVHLIYTKEAQAFIEVLREFRVVFSTKEHPEASIGQVWAFYWGAAKEKATEPE